MISNKFTQPFFEAITSINHTTDFESAVNFWHSINKARIKFENDVSDSLITLSDEQQSRLLLQVLTSLKDRESLYYVDEWYYRTPPQKEQYNDMYAMHQACMEYMFGVVGSKNRALSQEEVSLLSSTIISEEFNEANENIRQVYLIKEGEEKALPWILDKHEFIARNSEWKAQERERLGLPPDERTLTERLQDVFFEVSKDSDTIPDTRVEAPGLAPIPWRYGLADFAETLYKLERKGAIDLMSYFSNGGTGTGLVRSICQLFSFPNDKPGATLNNYLSEIKKNLGRGPLDAGVLKAIGRIRGGKMDDVLPE